MARILPVTEAKLSTDCCGVYSPTGNYATNLLNAKVPVDANGIWRLNGPADNRAGESSQALTPSEINNILLAVGLSISY
jgi:hypothetical protein